MFMDVILVKETVFNPELPTAAGLQWDLLGLEMVFARCNYASLPRSGNNSRDSSS